MQFALFYRVENSFAFLLHTLESLGVCGDTRVRSHASYAGIKLWKTYLILYFLCGFIYFLRRYCFDFASEPSKDLGGMTTLNGHIPSNGRLIE